MFHLAETMYAAEGIMLASAGADDVVRSVSRIAAKLLQWYPGGQMLAWGVSSPVAWDSYSKRGRRTCAAGEWSSSSSSTA